jgi:Prp8 binding protein
MSVSLWTAGATNEWLGPSPSNTVQLQGHTGSVYVCQFNPQGTILATAGHDRRVYLWVPNSEVGPTCDSVLMHHHCGPITGCAFSVDSANIVSCSADKTLSLWDTEEAKHIRRFRGHSK